MPRIPGVNDVDAVRVLEKVGFSYRSPRQTHRHDGRPAHCYDPERVRAFLSAGQPQPSHGQLLPYAREDEAHQVIPLGLHVAEGRADEDPDYWILPATPPGHYKLRQRRAREPSGQLSCSSRSAASTE